MASSAVFCTERNCTKHPKPENGEDDDKSSLVDLVEPWVKGLGFGAEYSGVVFLRTCTVADRT